MHSQDHQRIFNAMLLCFYEGQKMVFEPLEKYLPSAGVQLVYEDGDTCELTGKPRRTIIKLPCDPDGNPDVPLVPARGYEGEKQAICNYHVEFMPSRSFCPTLRNGLTDFNPVITAGKLLLIPCDQVCKNQSHQSPKTDLFLKFVSYCNQASKTQISPLHHAWVFLKC